MKQFLVITFLAFLAPAVLGQGGGGDPPPAQCIDRDNVQIDDNPSRDCGWVAKKQNRCDKVWQDKPAFKWCSAACFQGLTCEECCNINDEFCNENGGSDCDTSLASCIADCGSTPSPTRPGATTSPSTSSKGGGDTPAPSPRAPVCVAVPTAKGSSPTCGTSPTTVPVPTQTPPTPTKTPPTGPPPTRTPTGPPPTPAPIPPPPSPPPSPPPPPVKQCLDMPGWTNDQGNGCDWYQQNQPDGCPNSWYDLGTDDVPAGEACCRCNKKAGGSCVNKPGWTDTDGYTCDWYDTYEAEGCPEWKWYPGNDGTPVSKACCKCKQKNMVCENEEDWEDIAGYTCDWYEQNEKKGCPNYWWYHGRNGITAEHACCHCRFQECQDAEGWADDDGFRCQWWRKNDRVGCPDWGWVPGANGLTAKEACCHCNCKNRNGWMDENDKPCKWYENNDKRGCPLYGENTGRGWDGETLLALQACCHCRRGVNFDYSFLPGIDDPPP